jgi:hypothetical protein
LAGRQKAIFHSGVYQPTSARLAAPAPLAFAEQLDGVRGDARVKLLADQPVRHRVVMAVERWILARRRNRRFFSLRELNDAIAELVADLNLRPMRRLSVSRRDLFLELDRPALKSLPAKPCEFAEWRPRRE